ncbi:YitT family protein [Acholeplasma sp. OttesenSCG-928-E16]|nr:YitT family protein [Acholeplasma sp. OttesenSCG-928-E16]
MNIFKAFTVRSFIEITLGVMLIAVGFYFFLSPLELVTGGVMGVSILFQSLFGEVISKGLIQLILNIILLIIGLLVLGKDFFVKTAYGTILSPLLQLLLETLKVNPMLILGRINESLDPIHKLIIGSVVGGLLIGVGLGVVIKNNATTGGMDVVQNILHKKMKVPFSVALFLIDGLIIGIGAILYIIDNQIEYVFYAVISMTITGFVTDKLSMEGKSGFTFFIITDKGKDVTDAIFKSLDHGITKVEAIGAYSNEKKDMLICTIYKQREIRLKEVVLKTDPSAFIFFMQTKEALGVGFYSNKDKETKQRK